MTEIERCPGNELNKNVQIVTIECSKCGKENEIFGDELNKTQKCSNCSNELDTKNIFK